VLRAAMFNSSPIVASMTSSELEPEEMNGSGTPVSGASPRTAKTFSSAWHMMSAVSPAASSCA
jgi:hypothetical protein